jgi:hypothetical protein
VFDQITKGETGYRKNIFQESITSASASTQTSSPLRFQFKLKCKCEFRLKYKFKFHLWGWNQCKLGNCLAILIAWAGLDIQIWPKRVKMVTRTLKNLPPRETRPTKWQPGVTSDMWPMECFCHVDHFRNAKYDIKLTCVWHFMEWHMNFGCVGRNAIVTWLPWLSDWSSVDGLVVFSWQHGHGQALLEGSEGGRWTPPRWSLPSQPPKVANTLL